MRRVYGRLHDDTGNKKWVAIETDSNGYDDNVHLTALAQLLQLNLGESPFYANDGVPQHQTIMTQVFPDYYVMRIQNQYSQFFASLVITPMRSYYAPTYHIQAVTHSGAVLEAEIPI